MSRREEYKNMIVSANLIDNAYIVALAINGRKVNEFKTTDWREAADVYANTVNEMYAR